MRQKSLGLGHDKCGWLSFDSANWVVPMFMPYGHSTLQMRSVFNHDAAL